MRVLFTTNAMAGHFHPLVPLARAAQAAGHAVAVACPGSFCGTVKASGFQALPAGRDSRGDPEFGQIRAEIDRMKPGPAQARHFFAKVFCGLHTRRMIPDLYALSREWMPDVIVWENCAFAAAIVAEALGMPYARVEAGMLFDLRVFGAAVSEQLDRNRQSVGLPPDPDLEVLHRYLVLSWTPPRFQDPAVPLPPTLHALRAVPFDRSGHETLPDWVMELPERPTVYATLGTEMNHLPSIFPGMLQTFIAGLREEPVNLIVTIGRDMDPAALGPQPPHVHVERYIPQSLLLSHCDLVLTHGGHNTVLAAISAGLPMVVTPITADQPENAERCVALELGRAIALPNLTPGTVREAVRAVLQDAQYRTNVQRLRAETEALPSAEHGVRLLERLAATKTPQIARHAMTAALPIL